MLTILALSMAVLLSSCTVYLPAPPATARQAAAPPPGPASPGPAPSRETGPRRQQTASREAICKAGGEYAALVAEARDKGFTVAEVLQNITETPNATPQERDFARIIALTVYQERQQTPGAMQRFVETACLGSSPS